MNQLSRFAETILWRTADALERLENIVAALAEAAHTAGNKLWWRRMLRTRPLKGMEGIPERQAQLIVRTQEWLEQNKALRAMEAMTGDATED